MKRARLMARVTACWLMAVQPLLRRLMILPCRLVSFFKIDVLVIDIHRMRPLALDKDRVFLLDADLGLGPPLANLVDLDSSYHHGSLANLSGTGCVTYGF